MMRVRGFIFLAACASSFVPGHTALAKSRAHDQHDNGKIAACKAFPGTPTWPSQDTWANFNHSLGGRLIRPVAPPGAVCHPGQPTYNPEICASVTEAWSTTVFHQENPVSNMWQQFNNDTCLIDPNTPCSPDGYPAYVVNATTAQHVKQGLDFARKHNIRVVIKSTGHDYQGRSQAPGALSIWIHHMKSLELHANSHSFRPTGCGPNVNINTQAIKVGGGAQLGAIYDALDGINRTVVGGTSRTVGIGGYLTGGGHSVLSPHYGMGADNVLEMEVVTPKGEILTVNECQNQYLFWAMRGGGGSTFGIMTSATLATYPTPKMVGAQIGIYTPVLDAPWIWDMIGYVASQFPSLAAKGVSGYTAITPRLVVPNPDSNSNSSGTITVAGIAAELALINTQDTASLSNILDPVLATMKTRWPTAAVSVSVDVRAYQSLRAWLVDNEDMSPAGSDKYIGSRLLDEAAFSSHNSTYLGQVLQGSGSSTPSPFLVGGKGVWNARPRGGSTAVTPTWRKALAHVVFGVPFAPLNTTAKQEALAKVDQMTQPLRDIAPDMGAYINEAQRDWQNTFWGASNYARLLKIKRAVDPDDVLWCHPCVGNDRWELRGYRLCPVKGGRP
ncbi:FAD-binding domain-containing protein [Xylariaceae sp. FL0594]|nr:FAD-binding domain-containing protein [Xylariaceae sp. FL0594]